MSDRTRSGVAPEHEPLVGNLFVSTYPPFSCWDEAGARAFERVLDEAPGPEPPPLGLYAHVPFCQLRCRHCYYLSYEGRGDSVDAYVAAVLDEARRLARRPRLAGRAPRFVYVGGGTPTMLSPAQLERFLGGLRAAFPWDDALEVCVECAPTTATEERLRVLRDLGVTRVSLGVQQLDDDVLRRNGRIHLVADVERAWAAIRAAGFPVANVDLMTGLVGETDDTFERGLERVVALEPDSVTLYVLEVPRNTPLYRDLRAGTAGGEVPTRDTALARLAAGFARLEREGFTRRSAYAAVRDPERHRFEYQDRLYAGADLIAVGASAFSYVAGAQRQGTARLDDYLAEHRAGRAGLGRGRAPDPREAEVRAFVLALKLGRVAREPFRERFGTDPVERFARPVERLVTAGLLRVDADAVTVTRAGLLRVDESLPGFYLPEHRDIRYS